MAGSARFQLPARVVLQSDGLHDQALGKVYGINETGRVIVSALESGMSSAQVSEQLAREHELPESDARQSVLRFVQLLNSNYLLNPAPSTTPGRLDGAVTGSYLARTLYAALLPSRIRLDVSGVSISGVAFKIAGLFIYRWRFALFGYYLLLATSLLFQAYAFVLLMAGIPFSLAIALACHEAGHVAAIRALSHGHHPYFVGLEALTAAVHRRRFPDWRHECFISLAGPVPTFLIGLALSWCVIAVGRPEGIVWTIPFLLQAATLLPIWGDGRNILRSILSLGKGLWGGHRGGG